MFMPEEHFLGGDRNADIGGPAHGYQLRQQQNPLMGQDLDLINSRSGGLRS